MYRHALVRSLVLHYLGQFGYKGPPVRIYTTASRVKRHRITVDRGEDGSCTRFARSTVIFVNLARHDTLADLMDTCAHEALHAAKYTGHPASFDAEVAEAVLA